MNSGYKGRIVIDGESIMFSLLLCESRELSAGGPAVANVTLKGAGQRFNSAFGVAIKENSCEISSVECY